MAFETRVFPLEVGFLNILLVLLFKYGRVLYKSFYFLKIVYIYIFDIFLVQRCGHAELASIQVRSVAFKESSRSNLNHISTSSWMNLQNVAIIRPSSCYQVLLCKCSSSSAIVFALVMNYNFFFIYLSFTHYYKWHTGCGKIIILQ